MRYDLYGTSFIGLGVSCRFMDKQTIAVFIFSTQNNVSRHHHAADPANIVHVKTLQYDRT